MESLAGKKLFFLGMKKRPEEALFRPLKKSFFDKSLESKARPEGFRQIKTIK